MSTPPPISFPANADRELAEELTPALLRAEGVETPGPAHLDNTGAYIHRLPACAVNTARSGAARTVRVQILTPPGVLNRAAQRSLVAEVTRIVARISGDPTQAARTWVLLTEAAEGGWGIAGTAFGRRSSPRSPRRRQQPGAPRSDDPRGSRAREPSRSCGHGARASWGSGGGMEGVARGGWRTMGRISSMVEIRGDLSSLLMSSGTSSRSRRFCDGMRTCLMPARWAARSFS